MNSVQLVGRLTREVDLRFTQSGVAVGSFTVAVNRNFTNKQGERETDFIRCVIWRKSAENFANFTRKGSLVGVEGRIQTRSYEDSNKGTVYITEVVVDNFHLLEPKSVTEQRPREQMPSGNSSQNYIPNDNDFGGGFNQQHSENPSPFNENQSSSNEEQFNTNFNSSPFQIDGGQEIDISQDDLPF